MKFEVKRFKAPEVEITREVEKFVVKHGYVIIKDYHYLSYDFILTKNRGDARLFDTKADAEKFAIDLEQYINDENLYLSPNGLIDNDPL